MLFSLSGFAQNPLNGQVTFVTSSSIYARFESTENIKIGDTLNVVKNGQTTPCLIVQKKSTISTVNHSIDGCTIEKGDQVVFTPQFTDKKEKKKPTVPEKVRPPHKTQLRGSVSAATYYNHSSSSGDALRNMYRLSLSADHIHDSKFSAETYITYRQNSALSDQALVSDQNLFNLYGASIRYDVDSTLSVSLGRKIHRKAASLGPVDGLQAEKYWGSFYTGALVGFRPDIIDHSFNSDLLQYGGYIGYETNSRNLFSQTNIGLLQQTNQGNVDRRYLYFQHSSTIFSKLNLFSSMELDLFNQAPNGNTQNPRLTNWFASVRYRINRNLNFSLSYDTRKRILYYETFRTQIEQLLADDQARQGVRVRVNFRPTRLIRAGISYGRRFQSNGQNQSENINAYASMSKLPIGGRVSINANFNRSDYLTSKIVSLRHTRDLIPSKLSGDAYIRNVQYDYIERPITINQQYFGGSLTYYLTRKLVFSALGEYSKQPEDNNLRINARIIKRF